MLCTTGSSLLTTAATLGALYVCSVGLAFPTGLCNASPQETQEIFCPDK